MKKVKENAALPVLFSDVQVSLRPSVVSLEPPLAESVLGVVARCSLKQVFRINARRVITLVTRALPFFQRTFIRFIAKATSDLINAIHFYSSIALRRGGTRPKPTVICFSNVAIKELEGVDSHSAIGAIPGAILLAMSVRREYLFKRRPTYGTGLNHGPNYNGGITIGATCCCLHFCG